MLFGLRGQQNLSRGGLLLSPRIVTNKTIEIKLATEQKTTGKEQ